MMKKFWAVAIWEFTRAIKSKQFIITTILIPLIMGVSGAVPVLVQRAQQEKPLHFADFTGMIDASAQEVLAGQHVHLVSHHDREEAQEALAKGKLTGVLVQDSIDGSDFTLLVQDVSMDTSRLGWTLQRYLTDVMVSRRMVQYGISESEVAAIFAPVSVSVSTLQDDQTSDADTFVFDVVPFAFAGMLMLSAFFSGNVLMQSVIKEKQNRIGELLFSSAPHTAIMNGKVAAFGALGLVQMLIWALAALAVGRAFWEFDLALIKPLSLLKELPHFIAGYTIYAGMFAALGAATRDAQSGGQAQGTFVIIPLIPLMLAGPIIMDPNALWVKIMGFIPIFTPGVFLLRSGVTSIPAWEYLLMLAISSATALFMLRAASRIFFYGMLMTGRPATPREMIRWVAGR